MERSPTTSRFRMNPVEVSILSVAALIFVQSAYSLFYETPDFHLVALTPMKGNPLTEERGLASVPAASLPLQTIAIECGKSLEKEVGQARVRLTGPICGLGDLPNLETLTHATIKNGANHQDATVFAETNTGVFSTDYISLEAGKNPIQIEFSFLSGKSFSQVLVINKL